MSTSARKYFLFLASLSLTMLLAEAGTLAQFRTLLGDIEVELFDRDKPVTTANFIRYVQEGIFRDSFFHRWEPRFVLQGGGFLVTNRFMTNAFIIPVSDFGTITNEYGVGPVLSNNYGTLAMARVGGFTNSATSQFFFNLTNNAELDQMDGGFTVFGRVISGTNVLNRFNITSPTNGIFRTDLSDPLHPDSYFNELDTVPVLPINSTDALLVFVDITLLEVHVLALPGGGREISWNSPRGLTNHVEFTTLLPPAWISLASTNGTGERLSVTDSDAASDRRFYRVRVDY